MIGAIILGFIAGYVGRIFTPGSGVRGCLPTTAIGIVGALAGYLIFTEALDLGGLPGAVIGTVLVLAVLRAVARRREA
jgi:uncharacterized membrane protein YeaQ/YmgE (transglycosylase-associated protein family)